MATPQHIMQVSSTAIAAALSDAPSNLISINNKASHAAFHQWLLGMPQESIERLRAINLSTGSSRHVILALTYGIYDVHIRKINRMITSLLIARLKAERAGKCRLIARINDFMENMHSAIDFATGTSHEKLAGATPCNRSNRAQLARY